MHENCDHHRCIARARRIARERAARATAYAVTGVGRASSAALGGDELSLRAPRSRRCAGHRRRVDARVHGHRRCASGIGVPDQQRAQPRSRSASLGTLDDAQLQRSLAVNLVAPIAIANLFCRVFADATHRTAHHQCLVGSRAESRFPGGGPYSIAKAGLEMLTRQLAAEHDRADVFARSPCAPAIIDTDMQMFMRAQPRDVLPSVDLFRGFHRKAASSFPPISSRRKIVEKLVG